MRPLPTVDCSQPCSCIIIPYIYFYSIVEHMDRIIIASELDASTNRILDWVGGGDYREAVSSLAFNCHCLICYITLD